MDFMGIPLTEEMRAHLEQQNMAIESYRHDVQRLFDELSKEHMMTLRTMLNQFTMEGDSRLTSYYEGVVAATIAHRFDVCGGCGENHADVLLQERDGQSGRTVRTDSPIGKALKIDGFLPAQDGDKPLSTADLGFTDEQLANMEKYNLDDVRDEVTLELLGFICKGCGLRYVSIEDRMLRAPDACHGCYLKSAHG